MIMAILCWRGGGRALVVWIGIWPGGGRREKKGGKKTYAAVGAVGAAALLGRLVHLYVLHDHVARVEAFGVGVGFGVLEQAEEELGGFDGPAGA